MAAICGKSFKSLSKIYNSHNSGFLKSSSHRLYAVYQPSYKEPIVDKSSLKNTIEDNSKEQLWSQKIKPATNSQTCSIFYNHDVELFTNYIMRKGEKEIARDIIKDAFTRVKHAQLRAYNSETNPEKKKDILLSPVDVFKLAVKNVTPMLWYLKIRRSGSWYKVPVGITEEKAKSRAMLWLIEASSEKDKKVPFKVQLAKEILDAAKYEGKAIAKKIELHKMCEANRGYVNYWWT